MLNPNSEDTEGPRYPNIVRQALGKLRGIRTAIDKEQFQVEDYVVHEFHGVLATLENHAQTDLSGSRVPDGELQYDNTLIKPRRMAPLRLFRMKLEGVIEMFELPDEFRFIGPRKL